MRVRGKNMRLPGSGLWRAALLGLAILSGVTGAGAGSTSGKDCTMDAIEQAVCIYQAILADVSASYEMRGGGGISAITQLSSTSFAVRLPQEGQVDILTYEVAIEGGKVRILSRSETNEAR